MDTVWVCVKHPDIFVEGMAFLFRHTCCFCLAFLREHAIVGSAVFCELQVLRPLLGERGSQHLFLCVQVHFLRC